MERLLCGDVGYGKTEVIFRAIFKTIMNNKQVCYLCPTTVLAKQQYNSALKRFSNHAVRIKLLTRHTKLSEVHEIEKDLKEGKIDIIFGTHKLLNPSIKYKNIGLLVIDEEHKFGVEHKEKIKEIFTNVHVLSVSATPIPRSLQMSLVGIRDMSLIETAPNNRYPVQTYVIKQDFFLITSAIEKEISRKGQVFILINNISKLEEWKKKLQNKFPNLIIEFIHGQLENDKSSEIMDAFANKKIDILITTTIIENGIDIPNANTIIVIDADNFGLSQLYQIRGRVGRSDKIAYAYLMYDDKKLLNDAAKKRLKAIKEFTTLGSGYKISMRDLSIRGAGDLLGKEQAGFIDSVGVDMYLELINEELENKEEESVETNKISLNAVDTHISKKYTSEDEMLIELHEQISNIKSKKDYKIVYEEILDKYGFIDSKMEIYLKQSLLENLIQKYKIKLLNNTNYVITLSIPKEVYEKTKVEELFLKILNVSIKFNFKYQNNNIILSLNKLGLEKNYVDYLLDFCEIVEEEMK